MKDFREKLKERQDWKKAGFSNASFVCVGLDPLPEKVPDCIKGGSLWSRVATQMIEIVDATASHAAMFKPQKAHYEAIPEGQKALQAIVDHIHYKHPDIPVFLDCKRGDIDRTQQRYRIAHFEIDGVDGMNFNPYMGKDCMEKLVDKDNLGRAIVGLCYTSNKSARETQDVMLKDGRFYWEFIAETTLRWAEELGVAENAGLVMAAAYEVQKGSGKIHSLHLHRCRGIVRKKLWFLIPGIGTQEGFVKETVSGAYAGPGSIAINSSSGITFASAGPDFAERAADETYKLKTQINTALTEHLRSLSFAD